jgi:RNA polymerase sigma factor (sigma-70 family)
MHVNHKTDEDVIDEIMNGNNSSFIILIDRYKDYAYTIAFNILTIEEDAEEVSQDAFIKAFNNLKKFNRESKFSTWLYRIVFNTALTAKKKQKKNTHFDIDHAKNTLYDDAISISEVSDRHKYISMALNRLSEADNTALTLFYLKELSLEEICEIINASMSSLKVRLHRARKRMAIEMNILLNEEALNL